MKQICQFVKIYHNANFDKMNVVMNFAFDEFDSKNTFFNDVLRIEIIDFNQKHLNVIDVSDIFKRIIFEMTTKANIKMMKNIIHNYMKNARCIMLIVMSTNVDIVIQKIFEKIEKLNSKKTRTLKIFTKSNLIDKNAKKHMINLIENKTHQFKLD